MPSRFFKIRPAFSFSSIQPSPTPFRYLHIQSDRRRIAAVFHHGGVIPGRTPRELPETFGIFIETPKFPSQPTAGGSSQAAKLDFQNPL